MRPDETAACRPRPRKLARLALSLAIALATATPWIASAQERTASLSAKLTLQALDGRQISAAENDRAFRLAVEVTDIVTGRPPIGLRLSGWIRPVDRYNRSCANEARAFRATRAIPGNAIDLNGVVVTVLSEDNGFGIVDPKLNGLPATMIGAAALNRAPSDVAMDRANLRALFAFDRENLLEEVSLADGSRKVIASDLDRPSAIAVTPRGDLWVVEDGTGSTSRLKDGRRAESLAVGHGLLRLFRPSQETNAIGVAASDGGLLLMDGATARIVFQGKLDRPLTDAVFLGEDGVIVLPENSDRAELRYFSDFATASELSLGFPAKRLALSPDGRVALAYAPDSPGVAIIDVATAQVVQALTLNDATVAEVAFTDRAAFIATQEGRYVAVLDLKSVRQGSAAVLRPVPLGGEGSAAPARQRLLASMLPMPQMLAVDRARLTGWIVPEMAAVGNIPPMDSVKLPGGLPLQVHVVDRSFRETRTGRFETVARIRNGGEHELVLTTGIGGLTSCIRFDVDGPASQAATRLYNVSVQSNGRGFRAQTDQRLEFVFRDEEGHELDVDAVRFLVPSLTSPWSAEVQARRDADGKLRATMRFPHPGPYAVQPIGVPNGWKLRSTPMIEVSS